jgi:hypothetical protein
VPNLKITFHLTHKGVDVAKLSKYVANWLPPAAGLKTVTLTLASSVLFVSMAHAEHFRCAETVSIQSDNATINKQSNQPTQISGHLVAKGAGLFKAESKDEEVVTVTVNTDFKRSTDPNSRTHHQVTVLTFADGSTIKLESEGSANGKRSVGRIMTAQGTGRFKNLKLSGTVTGHPFDPELAYVVMEGDYEVN